MKKFFAFALLSLLFLGTSTYAQTVQYFTAMDGYDTALEEVSTVLDSPELIFIGTRNMLEEESELMLDYNTSNGTANAWIYVFREAEFPEIISGVFVIKAFIYVPFLLDQEEMEGDFPMFSTESLTELDMLDSDDANIELLKCPDYANYIETHPVPGNLEIAMFVNTFHESLPTGQPFWSLTITDDVSNSNISASTHCVTKELICETYTSVKELIADLDHININQYGNNIKVSLDNSVDENIELSVYSLDGAVLFNNSYSNISGELEVYFPFDSFSSGSFYISAKTKHGFGVQPVVIVK